MTRGKALVTSTAAFDAVRRIGLSLPDVEAATRYNGFPVLRARGCFLAGLASHPSAEPGTLVVKMSLEQRPFLLDEAPETYYVTDYYRPYPVVLVRLSRADSATLRDLLSMSRHQVLAKPRGRAARRHDEEWA
jgi:hypothetical protein